MLNVHPKYATELKRMNVHWEESVDKTEKSLRGAMAVMNDFGEAAAGRPSRVRDNRHYALAASRVTDAQTGKASDPVLDKLDGLTATVRELTAAIAGGIGMSQQTPAMVMSATAETPPVRTCRNRDSVTCFKCGMTGHYKWDCKERGQAAAQGNSAAPRGNPNVMAIEAAPEEYSDY